jgi:hypothetical protein
MKPTLKIFVLLTLLLLGAAYFTAHAQSDRPTFRSVTLANNTDSTSATVTRDGTVRYDPVTDKFRAMVNGSWVTFATANSLANFWKVSGTTTVTTPIIAGDVGFGVTPTYQIHLRGSSNNKNVFIAETDDGADLISAYEVGGVRVLELLGSSWALYILDETTTVTTGGTITLDLNSQKQRMFVGSATFATTKTVALSNASNALVFNFHFEVTNVAGTLVFPANFLMADSNFDTGTDTWTPPSTGKYELGGSYDGTNWKIKIAGPFL